LAVIWRTGGHLQGCSHPHGRDEPQGVGPRNDSRRLRDRDD
jgi:hypothetical protein